MKKTTQKKFHKRLAQYGALTAAITGVADASGQIIYTDIDPDYASVDLNIGLDLNNDMVFDFVIADLPYPAIAINAYQSASGNGFLGSAPNYTYPFALDAGDTISSGQTSWFDGVNGTMNYVSCYNGIGSSNWCGVTDKYLGLRFTVGADQFYGWARLDVNQAGDQFILKEYAYNSTPGEAINAGQQVLGIDENQFSNVRISALNKAITISNLTNNAEYVLFDLSGKTVMNGEAKNNNHVIEANFMATGVYILQLKDINTDAVIRKKVIL